MQAIGEDLEARNPAAARRVGSRIRETIDLRLKFPSMGYKGAHRGRGKCWCRGCPTSSCIGSKATRTKSGWPSLASITALGTVPGNDSEDHAAQDHGSP